MVNDNSYAYRSKDFSKYSCKQLKSLLNRSNTVTSIGIVILIGAIFQLIVAIGYERIVLFDYSTRSFLEDFSLILIITGVIAIFVAIGILNRTSWGRWTGLIFCIMYLIGFPIGTVIGIFGIPAFLLAKELFGDNRIDHASIKEERKRRKEAGIIIKGDSLFSRLLAKLAANETEDVPPVISCGDDIGGYHNTHIYIIGVFLGLTGIISLAFYIHAYVFMFPDVKLDFDLMYGFSEHIFVAFLYLIACILLLLKNKYGWFLSIAISAYHAGLVYYLVMIIFDTSCGPFADVKDWCIGYDISWPDIRAITSFLLFFYLIKGSVTRIFLVKRWHGIVTMLVFVGLFLIYSEIKLHLL